MSILKKKAKPQPAKKAVAKSVKTPKKTSRSLLKKKEEKSSEQPKDFIADGAYESVTGRRTVWLAKFVRDLVERSLVHKCSFKLYREVPKRKTPAVVFEFFYDKKEPNFTRNIKLPDDKPLKMSLVLTLQKSDCKKTKKSRAQRDLVVNTMCRTVHDHKYVEWSVFQELPTIEIRVDKLAKQH